MDTQNTNYSTVAHQAPPTRKQGFDKPNGQIQVLL